MEAPLAGAGSRGLHWLAVACALALLAPAAAQAAEVQTRSGAGPVVEVPQGGTKAFDIQADATGQIGCTVGAGNPATLRVATEYGIAGDGVVSNGVQTGPLPFYSNGQSSLLTPGRCGVAWNGAPTPYGFRSQVATASTTPLGSYDVPIATQVANPALPLIGGLEDRNRSSVTVRVVPASSGLAAPREDRTINVFPLIGDVRIRYPGTTPFIPINAPRQVPENSELDLTKGHAELVTDKDGRGNPQSMEFWDGFAGVSYTRRTPGSGERSATPVTELRLSRPENLNCAGAVLPSVFAADKNARDARRRRRRRRMWGRGRGRFRTRGRHGAATVRGTRWLTTDGCSGTKFEVVDGVVSVRDEVIDRTTSLRRGQSYLAAAPERRRGDSRVSRGRRLRLGGPLFAGSTTQGIGVRFRRTSNRVGALKLRRHFLCRKGNAFASRTGGFGTGGIVLRVNSNGRFIGRTRTRGSRGSLIRRGRASVRGSFFARGRRGRGAFRERVVLRNGFRCDTGRVRFRVRVR